MSTSPSTSDDGCDLSDTEIFASFTDDTESQMSQASSDTNIDSLIDSSISEYYTPQSSLEVEYTVPNEPIKSSKDTSSSPKDDSEYSPEYCSYERSREHLRNDTEVALSSFDQFISLEWPQLTAEGNDKALEVLILQLEHGGGFCTSMKLIDLSTPDQVRFCTDDVLSLLKEKMSHCTISSVKKFVLPNVKKLGSGKMVEELLGDFCGAICGCNKNAEINEVVLRCDEVSSEFIAGDLKWVDSFFSLYRVDRVTVHAKGFKSKEFKKLHKRLHGKKKIHYQDHDKNDFLIKRSKFDNDGTCKKPCVASQASEEKDQVANSTMDDKMTTKVLNDTSYSTVLWDLWKTGEFREKHIDGKGVTIAILASGINISHEVFKGKIIAINDITCSGDIYLTTDRIGLGTLCASVACGAPFKSTRSGEETVLGPAGVVPAGVAPAANIVAYKITGKAGQADTAMITKGLKQCSLDKERYNIDIVLLLYGSDDYDPEQMKAIRDLHNQGVLIVTTSGDNGELKKIPYPARLGYTICVGAHDDFGNTIRSTTKGRALDFTAPGENLAGASSVHPSVFTKVKTGTSSVAAACVAGLLALVIQRARDIASNEKESELLAVERLIHDQDRIKEVLRNISMNPNKHKTSCGYGRLKPEKLKLLKDNYLLKLLNLQ